MGKDKKGLNPADAFRREQKKLEAKKNKHSKEKVKEIRDLLNSPEKLEEKIAQLQKESDENKLDKTLKDEIKHYKEMYTIALNKQKMSGNTKSVANLSSSSEATYYGPVITSQQQSSSLMPTLHSSTSTSSSSPSLLSPSLPPPVHIQRRPDESIYYHPVYNPSGQPPLGQPQMYRPLQPPKLTTSGQKSMPRGPPSSSSSLTTIMSTGRPIMTVGGVPRGISTLGGIPLGGQYGIPLPPPPPPPPPTATITATTARGILMGSQNGIPLPPPPPPPPPPEMKPIQSPFANFPINSQVSSLTELTNEVKPKSFNRIQTASINACDPLDPNAKGYVNRFVNSKPSLHQPPPKSNHLIPTSLLTLSTSIPEVTQSDHQDQEHRNEQKLESQLEQSVGTSEPQLLSFDLDSIIIPTINVEELMRRRFELPPPSSSSEIDNSEQIIAKDTLDTEVVGPTFDPSTMMNMSYYLPTAEEVLGYNNHEEDDENEKETNYTETNIDDKKDSTMNDKKNGNSNYDAKTKISKEEENVVVPLSLAVLGDYGDDDDDDDNDEDTNKKDHDNHSVIQSSLSSSIIHPTYSHITQTNSISYPMINRNENQHQSVDNRSNPIFYNTDSIVEQSISKSQTKIKVDSNLTKFIPSALRIKRSQSNNASSNPISKLQKTAIVDNHGINNSSNSSNNESMSTTEVHSQSINSSGSLGPIKASVDDAYKQFLDEIGALGGLE